jgi:hypothetical protein
MLFTSAKEEALAIHKRAVAKYDATVEDVRKKCEKLYVVRKHSLDVIENIERFINSIANSPKELGATLAQIQIERKKFRQTEEYALETYRGALQSGAAIAAGVAGGAAIASIAPAAAMWIATTFGTASTGTAISTLSGAVATKAALAWLGGGGGAAAGQALLALAGPIGWSITAVTTTWSFIALNNKNQEVAEQTIAEAKRITIAGAQLKESGAMVDHFDEETDLLLGNVNTQTAGLMQYENCSYLSLTEAERLKLGALVNNTLSLAEMLNKTVG